LGGHHFVAVAIALGADLICPRNIASMLASSARLIRRAEALAARPDASEDDRLRSGLFLLMNAPATAAGALWGIGYTLLGRPLAGAIPGGFAIIVVAISITVWRRRRIGYLPFFFLLLILLLPALLQASLGGYVKGSAVIVWSFFAPLGAFVLWGSRAGWRWTAAFVAVVSISAIFDAALSRSTPSLPIGAQTALFAFNFCGVAASVTLVLAYFRIQRDEATARSERLLLNVLPPEIAERLKRDEYPIADRFEDVTVLFADMAGFTVRSATESPEAMVKMLNEFLSAFDGLAQRHGLRPIRTTGDSYLVVGGLPIPRPDHAEAIADMALDMLQVVDLLNDRHGWGVKFRIGMNTGPTMAAVVGQHRFTYDVWSDAVNTASRMESTGVPGRIQVTDVTYRRLCGRYLFEPRGPIEVKGKGTMTTYFLVGHKPEADGQPGWNAAARSAVEEITGPPELTRGPGSDAHVASGPYR
jgi:adenylate cyclase